MVQFNGYDYDGYVRRGNTITNKLPETPKPVVLYSLFRKTNGQWKRVRTTAFPERVAMRLWYSEVICNPLSFSLRKVKIECDKAEGITKGYRAVYNEFRDSALRERSKQA